jgi:ribulose-phosphate 3-epimerase
MPETIDKVSEIRKKLDALRSTAWLEVDGGIDEETLPKMKEAGATAFVAATAVFKDPEGPAAGVRSLRDVIARSEATTLAPGASAGEQSPL